MTGHDQKAVRVSVRTSMVSALGLIVAVTAGCEARLCRYSRDIARIHEVRDSPCTLDKPGVLRCEELKIEVTSYTKTDSCDNTVAFLGSAEDRWTRFARDASAYMVGVENLSGLGQRITFDPNNVHLVRADGKREPPICVLEFPRSNAELRISRLRCDPSGEDYDVEILMSAHRDHGAPEDARATERLETLDLSDDELVIFAFRGHAEPGLGLALDLGEVRWNGTLLPLPLLKFEVKRGRYPSF